MQSNSYLNANAETAKAATDDCKDYLEQIEASPESLLKVQKSASDFKLTDTQKGTELKTNDKMVFDSMILNDPQDRNYSSITPYVKIPQTKEQAYERSLETNNSAPNQ